MTDDEDITAAWHKLAFAQTSPLFMQNAFLHGGRGEMVRNATASFVKFHGKYYAVTCWHVLDLLRRRNQTKEGINDTAVLQVGRTFMNLAQITGGGLRQALAVPRAKNREEAVDIAIASMKSFWGILEKLGKKQAIDLDAWHEPRWSKTDTLLAFGYPDEHKEKRIEGDEDKIAAPLVMVAAPVVGHFSKRQKFVHARSRTDVLHGYFCSGMSGGAIYAQQDKIIVPAGIIFEGWPQSKRTPTSPDFDGRDIIIRGVTLTPDRFEGWLKSAGFLQP